MKKILCFLTLLALLASSFLKADETKLLTGSVNDFTKAYYEKVSPEENYCFSPYSLFSCLSLAYLGSEGSTALEMEKGLHLKLNKKSLSSTLNAFKEESGATLNIADAIWIDEGFAVKPRYLQMIDAKSFSFNALQPNASSSKINSWVSDITHSNIKKLVAPENITKDTKVILTNAIYFKDSFISPFKKKDTHKKPFFGKTQEMVDTMEQTSSLPYYEDDMMQLLVTPMKSGRYGCFFLLPKDSLEEMEKSLKEFSFEEMLGSTKNREVHVELPKFKIKTKSKPKKALSSMGMGIAFSPGANFSGIASTPLKIDEVVHEALFDLNEEGVTAAAATGTFFGTTCVKPMKPIPISFIANKPFMFGIIDFNSGLVLFLGKMTGSAGSEDAVQH